MLSHFCVRTIRIGPRQANLSRFSSGQRWAGVKALSISPKRGELSPGSQRQKPKVQRAKSSKHQNKTMQHDGMKGFVTETFMQSLLNTFLRLVACLPDGPDSFALGGETRARGDGPPAAELRGRHKHPGQPGNHGPDVCIREGPHARRTAAAGEEPV